LSMCDSTEDADSSQLTADRKKRAEEREEQR
jgi:hypothetical protein